MDNMKDKFMKDKFARFSGISIILVSESMTLFTRLVDGYYELKNVLSIIITLYICINLVIVIYLYCKDQNREVKEQEERLDNREKELKEKESKINKSVSDEVGDIRDKLEKNTNSNPTHCMHSSLEQHSIAF